MHDMVSSGLSKGSRKRELKRGWPLLLATIFGLIPLQFPMHSAGIFMGLWQTEFGWTRSQIGEAMSIYTMALVLLSPFLGAVIDRMGPRIPALVSMLFLATGFAAFSMIDGHVYTLYAAYTYIAIAGIGTTVVPFNRAIVECFSQMRGLALAIAQCATAISILITPLLVYALLQQTDWRGAWLGMAAVPILLLPLIWFGLRPITPEVVETSHTPPPEATGIMFRDALRMPKLWLFAVSFALFFFGTVGSIGQLVPILNGIGLSTGHAVMLQSMMAGAVLVGRLGMGYLLDRLFASYLYLGVAIIGAVGFFILAFEASALAAIAVICIGLALGAEMDVASYMTSRYFGVRSYGKIFGIVYSALVGGGIAAHPYYGFVFDHYGNYRVALISSMVLMLLGGLLLIRQEPYPDFGTADFAHR